MGNEGKRQMSASAPTGNGAASIPRDWRPFALLVIDAQRDFWSEDVAAGFPDFPAKVERLLACCRAEGIDVIHLRAGFRPGGSDWMVNARLRGRTPCVEGTAGAETLDCAHEQSGEWVVIKHTWDGFQNPELSAYLQHRGKRFLLIAGLVTSVCVLFTAASAAQRGFLTALIEDCCADRAEAHAQTLKRYGGLVFRRTSADGLLAAYASWWDALQKLDRLEVTAAAAHTRQASRAR
jgi:nicotinamidase-related amidase